MSNLQATQINFLTSNHKSFWGIWCLEQNSYVYSTFQNISDFTIFSCIAQKKVV